MQFLGLNLSKAELVRLQERVKCSNWHAGKRAATSWRQPSWLPVNTASSRVFPRQIQCMRLTVHV